MAVVIDTNIIFSMLLSKNSSLRKEFLEQDVEFYAPNYVMVELFEHKEDVLEHSKLSVPEVYELLYRILAKINLISEHTISQKKQAKGLQVLQRC